MTGRNVGLYILYFSPVVVFLGVPGGKKREEPIQANVGATEFVQFSALLI